MAKGIIQKKQPKDFGIKKPEMQNFSNLAKDFNKTICDQPTNVLLFSKHDLSEFLANQEINSQTPFINPKTSLHDYQRKRSLVGFFINPFLNNLESNGNILQFQSVWAGQESTRYEQYLGQIINLPFKFKASTNSILAPFVEYETFNSEFNHNLFQFNDDAIVNKFGKCFISWYELKNIVEYSRFIGFTGSLVLTGNLAVTEPEKGTKLQGRCNTAFFTYRIIGFNEFTVEPSGTIINKKIKLDGNKKYLLKSNLQVKDGELQNGDFRIPAETWASPCPPMWRPN